MQSYRFSRHFLLSSFCLAALSILNLAACKNADPCKDVTCNGVGTCNVVKDKAICICQDGYDSEGATCVPNWCHALACAHGSCALEGNNPYCKCEEGYIGPRCDECDTGYSPNNGKCLPDGVDPSQCTPNPCENDPCAHGVCRCNPKDNSAVCLCDSGYTGKTCTDCAPDYTPDGLNCVFNNCATGTENDKCKETTCGKGGTCACDPITGIAACECEFPYTGDYCNECLYGYNMQEDGTCAKAPPCNVITFTYENPAVTSVKLGGDWLGCQNWAECAKNMTKNSNGVWEITETITSGGRHIYKFNINNDPNYWAHDPNNSNQVDDGFGGKNNYIDVCSVCNVSPDPCESKTCSYHGGCSCSMDDTTPVTTCMCGEGYAGADCQECASGYVPKGNRCVAAMCGDAGSFDWRDAVLYFVMTDRFFDSDGQAKTVQGATNDRGLASAQYLGGDWKGVTEKMSYLADLGVTAIWLGAPYKNRNTIGAGTTAGDTAMYSSYHGYWPSPKNTNYAPMFTGNTIDTSLITENRPVVEDRLGTEQDLRDLIAAAHSAESANGQGIKILFDYVMNHIDTESGLYQATKNNGWYYLDNGNIVLCGADGGWRWDDAFWCTKCAFTDYLAPFDYDQAAPREWSVNDALWWAKEYGIDGYRLDAIKHVPIQWLTDLRIKFNSYIKNPAGGRFYLVGETYDWGNRDLLNKYVNPATMLDGQFDFPMRQQVCNAVMNGGYMSELANWMQGNDSFYTKGALMSTFLGNHDMPRVIHTATGQVGCTEGSYIGDGGYNSWTSDRFTQPQEADPYRKLGVTFAVLLLNPGLPLIFYGDEIGLAGGGDPDNRRMMTWDESKLNNYQKELRSTVKALATIRGQNKAITRGKRTTISSTPNTWIYKMGGCGDEAMPDIIVAINKSSGAENVNIPAGSYTDLMAKALGGSEAVSGGQVALPAYGIKVLKKN